jgi:diguanylate cyclase (GGDEF)-like protein
VPKNRGNSAESLHGISTLPLVTLRTGGRVLLAVLAGLAVTLVAWKASGYDFTRTVIVADLQTVWYLAAVLVGLIMFGLSISLRRLSRHMEAQARYLASIDPLTGLPNRNQLDEHLHSENVAVLYMDVDRFKHINDSLGHNVGDEVLRIVANRIRRAVRQSDLVFRLGGDEFVVVVEDEDIEKAVAAAAARIRSAVAMPLQAAHRDLFVTASIGIALKCPQLSQPADLVRAADLALYRAKRQGGDQAVTFNSSMESNVLQQFDLENDLWRAIERDELEVHYQPEVSMQTGRITGFEALVRWRHPEYGLLKPDRFLNLAEENGALNPIGLWVLAQSCNQWRRWRDLFPDEPPIYVSVNLSLRQLHHPELVEDIARTVLSTEMDPSYLKLEITESVLLTDAPAALGTLSQLEEMGIKLAIDDFGTGYSALSYLKLLPVQSVKIDQSFVQNLETDDTNPLIVQAIITLAHDLGLDVTAEGVETRGQFEFVRDLGCDRGQGYFLAEPLPQEVALATLESHLGRRGAARVA